jgi:L-iditol 2-dehydrogenase
VAVDKTRRKEITIQFVRRQADCTEKSLEMILNREVDVSRMVTHRFHFSKAQDAFDLVAGYRDGVMKAMIDFGEEE